MKNTRLAPMLWGNELKGEFRVQAMLVSPYAVPLLCACKSLETDKLFVSHVHGQEHIERVMLMGAMIARAEKFTRHETELLLFACSYHDIGRKDDSRDEDHGRRSAQMIVSQGIWERFGEGSDEELKAMQAAICTHSLNDERLSEIAAEYGVSEEMMPLCEKLCFCLKDADNLDRVRLHDLDTKHLRHESSLKFVDTAQFVYNHYNS